MKKDWLDFEKLVAHIYSKISVGATVVHNDKILGKNSGRLRQIDVSIKQILPGGHEIIVIVSCKNYKNKPNIGLIDEFFGLLQDITASKGVLICKAGFGKTIKNYARNRNIDLCTVYDLENRDWVGDLKIPFIYIQNKYELAFKIRTTIPESLKGVQFPEIQNCVFSFDKQTLIRPHMYFVELWNKDLLDKKPNKEHNKYIDGLYWNLDSYWVPVETFIIKYQLRKTGKIKFITPEEYFKIQHHTKDEKTEIIEVNQQVNLNDPTWTNVSDPENIEKFFPGLHFLITENENLKVDMLSPKE